MPSTSGDLSSWGGAIRFRAGPTLSGCSKSIPPVPTEAIEVYSQVIKFNPEKEILYVGRAEAYLFAGQYAKADKDIEKAMELDPDDPVVYVLRALGKLARYERESAKADLKRAVELGYDRESAEQLLRQEE